MMSYDVQCPRRLEAIAIRVETVAIRFLLLFGLVSRFQSRRLLDWEAEPLQIDVPLPSELQAALEHLEATEANEKRGVGLDTLKTTT